MALKERIFPGDTLPIAYECRKPDPDNDRNTAGLPATPDSAYVRLLNRQTGIFVEIGGPGDDTVDAEITPATGTSYMDKGAIVRYTLPSTYTQEPGDYTLYMTAVFADGAILTEDRLFKVNEYR